MPELTPGLAAEHSLILAVDTSSLAKAEELAAVARGAGAWVIKQGLELMSAVGLKTCAELAADYNLEWVADAKLYDIPTTVQRTVNNYSKLSCPPIGITIATKTGRKSLEAAQDAAAEAGITMLGVTHLTCVEKEETLKYEKTLPRTVVWRETRRAVAAGIGGAVCAGEEVGMVKRFKSTRGLFTMIPGTRSLGADAHDQKRSVTPAEAIINGADLLVIGREVTASKDPASEYNRIVMNIAEAQVEIALRRSTR